MLAAVGVPAAAIEHERLEISEIAFSRTESRSLFGSLNDFSLMVCTHFITSRNDWLERIARELAESPLDLALCDVPPSSATRRMLGAE